MKTLVAYLSQTGNTKKVAEAIYGEIDGPKDVMPFSQINSLDGYDIAFLGFPVHGEGPDKKEVGLLEKYCTGGKKVALFITHASPEGADETKGWLKKFEQAARCATIVDTFDCQGQLAGGIKFFMSIWPNATYRRWAKADNSHGQPDEARLERARAFSRDVMNRLREAQAGA